MKLYRDQDGVARAEADSPQVLLAEFLASDIQGDTVMVAHVISLCLKGQGELTGNAFSFELSEGQVNLENLFTEEAAQYPVEQVLLSLQKWQKFIQCSG
ncbi:hypothetical protein [Ferrimonas aestuarii]|uniref:Uncharacterized protein n=1 Tax=Ferrimonas aestuarii TaxID=2569539 RepID=A0A4U1BNZ3_9GAMM|nr:hypothetical protein [Ferrimonas aestuarii]TKB55500.1 hypothetical protein FCL42_09965 [Ferrimonas aestuarii]